MHIVFKPYIFVSMTYFQWRSVGSQSFCWKFKGLYTSFCPGFRQPTLRHCYWRLCGNKSAFVSQLNLLFSKPEHTVQWSSKIADFNLAILVIKKHSSLIASSAIRIGLHNQRRNSKSHTASFSAYASINLTKCDFSEVKYK